MNLMVAGSTLTIHRRRSPSTMHGLADGEWEECSVDLRQLGDTQEERSDAFAQLLHACQFSTGVLPLQLPSDAVGAEFLFRWESTAVLIDCLTDPNARAPLFAAGTFVPPLGAVYTLTLLLIESKDPCTAKAVSEWLVRTNVVAEPPIPPPPPWCVAAYERANVGSRDGAELELQIRGTLPAEILWQSFTYGECSLSEVSDLLWVLEQHCGVCLEGKSFVDLGHGIGNVVLAAALLRPWASVLGIELCSQRFAESQRLLARWGDEVAPTLPIEQRRADVAITLENGDILQQEELTFHPTWKDADIVFVHATCFDSMLLQLLSARAGSLKQVSTALAACAPATAVSSLRRPRAIHVYDRAPLPDAPPADATVDILCDSLANSLATYLTPYPTLPYLTSPHLTSPHLILCRSQGSVLLSVSKPLLSAQLEPMFAWGCEMSYSDGGTAVPVYIQRRRPRE